MPGKIQPKNQLIEHYMELQAYYDRSIEDAGAIVDLLNDAENKDHINDSTRNKLERHILEAIESNAANNQLLTSRSLHAAIQTLRLQEKQDYDDDEPRTRARNIAIALKNRAIANQRLVRKKTEQLNKTGR